MNELTKLLQALAMFAFSFAVLGWVVWLAYRTRGVTDDTVRQRLRDLGDDVHARHADAADERVRERADELDVDLGDGIGEPTGKLDDLRKR